MKNNNEFVTNVLMYLAKCEIESDKDIMRMLLIYKKFWLKHNKYYTDEYYEYLFDKMTSFDKNCFKKCINSLLHLLTYIHYELLPTH